MEKSQRAKLFWSSGELEFLDWMTTSILSSRECPLTKQRCASRTSSILPFHWRKHKQVRTVSEYWNADDYDSIVQVFKMFDKNQDGTVLVSDLRQILSHLGEVIPEDEIDILFRRLGYTDVIKYEEFAKVLLKNDDWVVCYFPRWSVWSPILSSEALGSNFSPFPYDC